MTSNTAISAPRDIAHAIRARIEAATPNRLESFTNPAGGQCGAAVGRTYRGLPFEALRRAGLLMKEAS